MRYIKLFENYINKHFLEWFNESEMTDRDNKPIVFYHGTHNEFETFDINKIGSSTDPGWLGKGFYFYTDTHEASQYGKVSKYHLKIKNTYYATDEDNEKLLQLNNIEASTDFSENLITQGYDGVHYNGNLRGETVVFEPNQIWRIKN